MVLAALPGGPALLRGLARTLPGRWRRSALPPRHGSGFSELPLCRWGLSDGRSCQLDVPFAPRRRLVPSHGGGAGGEGDLLQPHGQETYDGAGPTPAAGTGREESEEELWGWERVWREVSKR